MLKRNRHILIILVLHLVYLPAVAQCDAYIPLKGKSSKPLGRSGTDLELCVNIITTAAGGKYKYKLIGTPAEVIQVDLTFNYYINTGDPRSSQLRLVFKDPNASGEIDLPGYRSSVRVYEKLEVNTAETAGIPNSSIVNDVRVTPRSTNLIFEGDSLSFYLPELKEGVTTVWSTNGKVIDRENRKLTVRAEKDLQVVVLFRNGIFSSDKMSISVPKVSRLQDYYSYDVVKPPYRLHPDTLALRVSIRPKLANNSFSWHWYYLDKKTGKTEAAGTGTDFIRTPTNLTPLTDLRAALQYDNRTVAIEKIGVEVYEVPGPPSNFTVSPSNVLYDGETGRLEVLATDRGRWSSGLKWIWRIGQRQDTTAVPFYDIAKVNKNVVVSVRGYLNTKTSKEVRIALKDFVKIKSILPRSVLGDTAVCIGRAGDLSFKFEQAQLGSDNTKWVLSLDNKEYARSKTPEFKVRMPTKLGVYQFQLFPDKEPKNIFQFRLYVHAAPLVPDAIVQAAPLGQLCPGSTVTLTTQSSASSSITHWDWYLRDESASLRFLGTGQRLEYSLNNPTTFVLKSRTDQCVSTIERQLYVAPIVFNYIPRFSIINKDGRNSRYRSFRVSSPDLSGLRYMWYLNNQLLSSERGRSTTKLRMQKGSNRIKLAVMNECDQIKYVSDDVDIPKPTPFGFLALGATSNRADVFPNLMFTAGSRSLYLRAKFNPLALSAANNYKNGFMGVPLTVNDKSQLTNFPAATGMYYTIGSGTRASHTGLTVGGMFAVSNPRTSFPYPRYNNNRFLPVSLVLGAGYGIREVYWKTEVKSYADQRITSHWAKNIDQSWKGLELEGGIFIPISGSIFIQTGFSTIFDSNKQSPYTAFGLSLGVAFEKKQY